MMYTVYASDPAAIEHLAGQENVSEYIRGLIVDDLGRGSPVASPPQGDVLIEILAEIRLMRQDMANLNVVAEKPQESTKKEAPAGLARQAAKFGEGKRG